jgi:hypothetical protein
MTHYVEYGIVCGGMTTGQYLLCAIGFSVLILGFFAFVLASTSKVIVL